MSIQVRCRCGKVQGELGPGRHYARVTCYCRDCRAYAQWLGTPGLVDAAGGTDIVAMAPSRLRFTAGEPEIACTTISGKVHRWYAACCRTPLGNTARDPRTHYLGLCTACMVPAEAVDAAFGPAGRCMVNAGSATSPVRATPLTMLSTGLRVMAGILRARLRGQRASPFYDDATGRPIRTPDRAG